ncbi:MAG TPA: FtsQ-type POTRA domain-containing protein [Lachnospiraceae bacterium]|nr:FtsQ-type POTRA domain-containing protein [Lachnospiraceae bacterium]
MKKKIIIALVLILACVSVAVFFILKMYTVSTVYVEGNKHYSKEEIQEMVMGGKYGHNSIYLSYQYKNKEVTNIPFIETMDVTIMSPDTIKIRVYEKALAGYVEYLGRLMYFDKDGIIVESSNMKTEGIPLVSGLDFGHVVLYKELPITNKDVFHRILNITQILGKYKVVADKIYFNSTYEMTLYFGSVRVSLGSDDYIHEKVVKLQYILPELEEKSGILRMDSYTDDNQNITFELD